jgi:hypothetical protein
LIRRAMIMLGMWESLARRLNTASRVIVNGILYEGQSALVSFNPACMCAIPAKWTELDCYKDL